MNVNVCGADCQIGLSVVSLLPHAILPGVRTQVCEAFGVGFWIQWAPAPSILDVFGK